VGIYASPTPSTVRPDSSVEVSLLPVGELIDAKPVDVPGGADQLPIAHEFMDDDAGYLAWLTANPHGYVVNIARGHSVSAARLHHATCRTISGQNPHNGAWTGPYVKVCADQLAAAEEWAASTVGKPIPPCGICQPSSA
jgi:hypothetical protein